MRRVWLPAFLVGLLPMANHDRIRLILLGVFMASTRLSAWAESAAYLDAVSAYNHGDFGTSIKLFNAAINAGDSKNASAHYYLANAYLRLENKKAALDEYKLTLRLAPQGPSAKFCQQAIDHLEGTHPINETRSDTTKKGEIKPKVSDVNPKVYAVVKISGLPVIPAVVKDDGPSLSEILLWTLNQQSAYYQVAFNRKNQALARLDQANEILKKAESLASSAVPNARNYGESEDEWKKRIENGRAQLAEILSPYRVAVEVATKSVEQTNSIYETCLSAGRRLSGY